ncbi:type II secretion system protein [Luteolibacter algae]|uniref:Type II secretion system protein n=1 Tax=Luteolibacter algae TaxID=454151 RepID=A0ABW5D7H5_9BACT
MNCSTSKNGFTLLEMTVVIMVLLTLIGVGLSVSNQYGRWKLGRTASEELRTVYAAQRMYLADHPTAAVNGIRAADIIPYLANRAVEIPTVTSLDGEILTINVNTSPPTINDGEDGVYDPSGDFSDSLWDVGE